VTTLEDRLRAATRAAAQTVAPDSAPPLRLPDEPSRGPAGRGQRRWRGHRWSGWLVPLAAAVAVTAVIAGSLAISGAFHSRPRHGGTVSPRPADPDRVPPYYVALTFTGRGTCCGGRALIEPRTRAVVRATATGAVLATIAPPKPFGTFAGVVAASDDRTFVLAAQREVRLPVPIESGGGSRTETRFFLLRINPASASTSGRARLTPLPITGGNGIWDFALSPNGRSLAVLDVAGVHVFSLATGAERTWWILVRGGRVHLGLLGYWALGTGATNAMVAWQNDRTLAFVCYGAPNSAGRLTGVGIRFLDTRAPGMNLLADSRLAVPQPKHLSGPAPYWRQALPTADGRTVVAVLELSKGGIHQELAEFSARTGQLTAVVNSIQIHGNYEQVLWASPSGRSLLVTGTKPVSESPASRYMTNPGILTGGHFTPIPWPGQNLGAAW
jgi:hypothetical protein